MRRLPPLVLFLSAVVVSACADRRDPAGTGKPARRVVSLAPSHTELIFTLGAEEALVGVTTHCDRPAAAESLPAVGDSKQISLESIAALAPDLVLVNSRALEEALAPLAGRVRVLRVPTDTLRQTLDAVTVIGDAVGHAAAARELRARLEAALERARAGATNRPPTRVLVVVQRDPFFVAGHGSYVHELLEVLGYANAAGDLADPWPCISAEALLDLAPDAIVDAAPDATATQGDPDAEAMRYWSRFPSLAAVRDGRVRRLRDDAIVRPGPALPEALDALERSIAPATETARR